MVKKRVFEIEYLTENVVFSYIFLFLGGYQGTILSLKGSKRVKLAEKEDIKTSTFLKYTLENFFLFLRLLNFPTSVHFSPF